MTYSAAARQLCLWGVIGSCAAIIMARPVLYAIDIENHHRYLCRVRDFGVMVFFREPPSNVAAVSYAGHPRETIFGRATSGQPLYLDFSEVPSRDARAVTALLTSYQASVDILVLTDQPVHDADIAAILNYLQGLRMLDLTRTMIGGSCLSVLAKQQHLEKLMLDGTDVGYGDLTVLSCAPRLRLLSIVGVDITDTERSELKSLLPNCKIVPD
jgi:hypothetical protein